MRKAYAILLSGLLILTALGITVSAARGPAIQKQQLMGDAILTIQVYYGDGVTPCDNATVQVTRNEGGYARTEHTNEVGDAVTIAGVPAGTYTLSAYRPHPTLGKAMGILLWGEATNNQFIVEDGQEYTIELVLVGGLFQSLEVYQQPLLK